MSLDLMDIKVRVAREDPAQAVRVIGPDRGWRGFAWGELWRYRELLYFLTWRDVKIRYKQTALGALWAVLQPVMTMVVFTIFFGRLAGLEARTGGVPYPVLVFAGLLPWMFFANAMTNGGNSLVGSTSLVTKVYFPRVAIPLSTVGAGLVDLAISALVFVVLAASYRVLPCWSWLLALVFLAGVVVIASGMAILLAALTVEYRDFRYVIPFVSQIWMFVTPVMYPASIVPAPWRRLFYLNPMAGLVDGFRDALLGRTPQWTYVAPSLGVAILILLAGAAYFHKMEGQFADVI